MNFIITMQQGKTVTEYGRLLKLLNDAGVQFIVIGGVAAISHGSARFTKDVDVVYSRTADNISRIVTALAAHAPYIRGAPPGLPFIWDARTIEMGLNFTLTTDLGDIDLLGEIAGGGGYDQLYDQTESKTMFGQTCQCLKLETLIAVKRAAGRPKDFEAIAELEALKEERDQHFGA
jgi:predicted nucleotidyltransferase